MADGAGIGLDVALKRIPIQQETVEICEFFGVNPYQMLSTGALLIAAADGEGLVQKMALEGIPSADDIREGEDSPERGRGPVSG
jgi:hydrogenase expression/formation protein HypE